MHAYSCGRTCTIKFDKPNLILDLNGFTND